MRSTVHAESPFFSRDMSFLVLPVYCPTKLRGGGQCVQRLLVLRRKWTAFQILQELGMVPKFQIVQIIEYIHPPFMCALFRKRIGISTLPCSSPQPGRNTSRGHEVSGCSHCVRTGALVVPQLGSRPASGRCEPRSHPRW